MREKINNKNANNHIMFKVLNDNQCKMIYDAACRLLETYGWEMKNDPNGRAKKLLLKAGCTIEGSRVRFPLKVIEEALSTVPSEITLYDQLGNPAIEMSAQNSKSYTGVGPTPIFRYDVETKERRKALKQDAFNTGILCEALDNIDLVSGLTWISDCPEDLAGAYETRELLKSTTKPIQIWGKDQKDYKACLEMCTTVAGSTEKFKEKPFAATFCGNLSNADFLMDILESGVLLHSASASIILGVTSPVTIAGALVQGLAENLTVFVLSQIVKKGYPVLGTIIVNDTNFSNLNVKHTTPPVTLAAAAVTDLFRYLNLPASSSSCGDATNALVFDQQAAFDIATQLYTSKLCGTSLTACGFLECCLVGSMESLVYTDEILSYYNSLIKGIEVNEDTLAEEVIKQIGPNGSFISAEHTSENIESWMPDVFTLQNYADWSKAGSKDYAERANKKIKQIISDGVRHPKSSEILAKLDEIISSVENK